jgi:hypothetical protein
MRDGRAGVRVLIYTSYTSCIDMIEKADTAADLHRDCVETAIIKKPVRIVPDRLATAQMKELRALAALHAPGTDSGQP